LEEKRETLSLCRVWFGQQKVNLHVEYIEVEAEEEDDDDVADDVDYKD
jgi:hypothetical protein